MKLVLVLCLFLTACQLDALLTRPPDIPEKKCYWNAYYIRRVEAQVDTIWLGETEIPCDK